MDTQLFLRHAQTEEERLLGRRLMDLAELSSRRGRPVATAFLSPSEQAFASLTLEQAKLPFYLDGGFMGAQRKIAVVGACEREEWEEHLAAAIAITHPQPLTHRDFLGAAMAAGIKRKVLGDILVGQQSTVMLVVREMAPYLIQNLDKAGRVPLTLREMELSQITPPEQRFEAVRDTVASLRLDSLAASGFRLSREQAKEAVQRGLVQVNWRLETSPSASLSQGDTVSLRGKGKFLLAEVGGESRKGRVWVELHRFV